jgi:FAD/FMN-containing dehydrogenase
MSGRVSAPGDIDWDEARQAWNVAVDQRPAAVAIPHSTDDVVAIVDFARERGPRVTAQGTGHNAGAYDTLADTILVKTHEMRGVEIDADARVARVAAGTLWIEITEPASALGLAPLAGSSPDVGVVGYSLGGGASWLARKYGLSSNSVVAIELVTADGELVRVDADNEPDLFWALRGGRGNYGVVTHMEFLRGRQLVVIDGAFVGDEAAGAAVLQPLRDLGPEMDTFAMIPPVALSRIHMDPEGPTPAITGGGPRRPRGADRRDRAVGHRLGLPELHRGARRLGEVLHGGGLRAAAPRQGRGRPAGRVPREPRHRLRAGPAGRAAALRAHRRDRAPELRRARRAAPRVNRLNRAGSRTPARQPALCHVRHERATVHGMNPSLMQHAVSSAVHSDLLRRARKGARR